VWVNTCVCVCVCGLGGANEQGCHLFMCCIVRRPRFASLWPDVTPVSAMDGASLDPTSTTGSARLMWARGRALKAHFHTFPERERGIALIFNNVLSNSSVARSRGCSQGSAIVWSQHMPVLAYKYSGWLAVDNGRLSSGHFIIICSEICMCFWQFMLYHNFQKASYCEARKDGTRMCFCY
jgi:hypothetical protein